MPEKYEQTQFWELYKKLPRELKDALFDERTDESIYNACKNNNLVDQYEEISDYVGQVLIGLLKPDEFQTTLEKELKLETDAAKKVSQEINRFVFFPVKQSLEDLYSMEITPPAEMKIPGPAKKTPAKTKRKDTYREVIE